MERRKKSGAFGVFGLHSRALFSGLRCFSRWRHDWVFHRERTLLPAACYAVYADC